MSGIRVWLVVDQGLQPIPALLGTLQFDRLDPLGVCLTQRLPTLRVNRHAPHITATPLVNDSEYLLVHTMLGE